MGILSKDLQRKANKLRNSKDEFLKITMDLTGQDFIVMTTEQANLVGILK